MGGTAMVQAGGIWRVQRGGVARIGSPGDPCCCRSYVSCAEATLHCNTAMHLFFPAGQTTWFPDINGRAFDLVIPAGASAGVLCFRNSQGTFITGAANGAGADWAVAVVCNPGPPPGWEVRYFLSSTTNGTCQSPFRTLLWSAACVPTNPPICCPIRGTYQGVGTTNTQGTNWIVT